MNNTHKIKTLKDIVRVVNNDNVENFLIDFGKFMRLTTTLKSLSEITGKVDSFVDHVEFTWIDDGKNESKVNITVVEKDL